MTASLGMLCAALLAVFISTAYSLDSGVECSLESLDHCLMELDVTGVPLGRQILPLLTDAQLADMCRHWEESKPCTDQVMEDCLQFVNSTSPLALAEVNQRMAEVNAGHEILCDPNKRQEYQNIVQTCVSENNTALEGLSENNTALEGLTKTCKEGYTNRTWYYDTTNPDNIYAFCKAAKFYMNCIDEGLTKLCGESVAKWALAFHKELWQPHLDSIKCSLSSKMEMGSIAIITFCGGATLFCAVCVVASYIQDIKQSKKKKKADDGKGEYEMQQQESPKDL